jgi:hypothetical protein
MATTVADYVGRTFDVLALRNVQPVGAYPVDQSLFGGNVAPGGEVCTGIVKLAQWFTITLLTPKGSQQYNPNNGTTFITKLLNGSVRTETDVFIAFGFAMGDIKMLAAQSETADTPLDEQYGVAILNSVVISSGIVVLRITLTSQAGSSWKLILPIPTAPL